MTYLLASLAAAYAARSVANEELFRPLRVRLTTFRAARQERGLLAHLAYMPTCAVCASFWTGALAVWLTSFRVEGSALVATLAVAAGSVTVLALWGFVTRATATLGTK